MLLLGDLKLPSELFPSEFIRFCSFGRLDAVLESYHIDPCLLTLRDLLLVSNPPLLQLCCMPLSVSYMRRLSIILSMRVGLFKFNQCLESLFFFQYLPLLFSELFKLIGLLRCSRYALVLCLLCSFLSNIPRFTDFVFFVNSFTFSQ